VPRSPLEIALNDGHRIPAVGFGTWPLSNDQAEAAVQVAIATGYRLIDTAASYDNEQGVGRALRSAGLPRQSLFITTKLRGAEHGYEASLRALDSSLARLGLDYVDLYLIHWPLPRKDLYAESWRALVRMREEGRARSIGVSNFEPVHIERLLSDTGVAPAVNQIELHPDFAQPALRSFDAKHHIVTESWRPLGKGAVLNDPVLLAIARKHGKTPAQVVLRWHLELGLVAIPKSKTPERMPENLAIFDFALEADDLRRISALDRGNRQGGDPTQWEE
jgi:2,5-diketo-D-gluconate reductase A